MGLPLYAVSELSQHHAEMKRMYKHQPSWCLRDGLVVQWLRDVAKDSVIIDFGSGSGELEKQLWELGYQNVTSVDIDNYLDIAYIGGSPRFIRANLSEDRVDIPDASVDVVFALQVLEHLENPWHCAKEILRVAKPGAKILIAIPHATSFVNRVKFLFHGDTDSYSVSNNHLAFFTRALFQKLWHDQATVKRIDYAEGHVKFGRWKLRFRGRSFFGRMFTRKIAYCLTRH